MPRASPGCGEHLGGQPGRLALDICCRHIILGVKIPAERAGAVLRLEGERGGSSSHGIKGEKSGKGQSRAGLAGILLLQPPAGFYGSPKLQELSRPDQSSLLPSKSGVLNLLLPSRERESSVFAGAAPNPGQNQSGEWLLG